MLSALSRGWLGWPVVQALTKVLPRKSVVKRPMITRREIMVHPSLSFSRYFTRVSRQLPICETEMRMASSLYQWQLELDWAQALREKEQSRIDP
jgi:hypothetical protein